MLDTRSYGRPLSIHHLLKKTQRPVSMTFPIDIVPESPPLKLLVDFHRLVRAVRPQRLAGIVLVKEIAERLTVMDIGRRHLIIPNKFVLNVNIQMVLIAIVRLIIFLRPARIKVLLPELIRMLLPVIRDSAILHRLILFPRIALSRRLDKGRIDDLTSFRPQAGLDKVTIKQSKQLANRYLLRQCLPKQPDRLLIRNKHLIPKTKKPLEHMAIKYLKPRLLVGQVVQALQHQNFEHQNVYVGRTPGVALPLFAKRFVDNRLKTVPIDGFVQFLKRIPHLTELGKSVLNVKKANSSHDNVLQTMVNGCPISLEYI
jgi:hypothetical protein